MSIPTGIGVLATLRSPPTAVKLGALPLAETIACQIACPPTCGDHHASLLCFADYVFSRRSVKLASTSERAVSIEYRAEIIGEWY